jgi:hypothetical protein
MGRIGCIVAAIALSPGAGAAQVGLNNQPAGSQRIDPGVGDVGALPGISRIDLRRDLRQDSGFGTVYKFEGAKPFGGPGQTQSMFFRIDGGLTAVFPSSVYIPTTQGLLPEVPPGTTFYIGQLPASLSPSPPPPRPRSPLLVDLSASAERRPLHVTPMTREVASSPGGVSIWESEEVRTRTISRLLDRALEGHHER